MWTHAGPDTFPNGCMIAEVEVDPETGVVKIDRVCSVDDAGVAINPLTLDGQLHGSLVQAVDEMLMESVIYERGGPRFWTILDSIYARARRRPCVTMFGFLRQGR